MLVPLTATDMLPLLNFECCAAACLSVRHPAARQSLAAGATWRLSAHQRKDMHPVLHAPFHSLPACLPVFLPSCLFACVLVRSLAPWQRAARLAGYCIASSSRLCLGQQEQQQQQQASRYALPPCRHCQGSQRNCVRGVGWRVQAMIECCGHRVAGALSQCMFSAICNLFYCPNRFGSSCMQVVS